MAKPEIIPGLLKECPELQSYWDEYLRCMKTGGKERDSDMDASAIVLFVIIPAYRSGRIYFFPRFFAWLERLIAEGDEGTSNLAIETILKGLQRCSITKINGPELLGGWMGPQTKRQWDRIWEEAAKTRAARPNRRKKPERLREYKVSLTACGPGERAVPLKPQETLGLGMATKLGGDPDWLSRDERPDCPYCRKPMRFVAQIDSIEHTSPSNPHSREKAGDDQHWLFGDVGMIYVFFCFECGETRSVFQFH